MSHPPRSSAYAALVVTALLAALFLGEPFHACHAAGFALVAGGAILVVSRPDAMLSSRPPARTPDVR